MTEPLDVFGDGRCILYCGDCLEILPTLESGSVDAVVTDPPYSSGGQFRGDRTQTTVAKYVKTDSVATCRVDFGGDSRDQRSFLAWSSLWFGATWMAARPGAVALCFTDWRQLPVMTDSVQCGGWVWRGLGTWWKPGVRMQRGRFSGSAEYVIYASKGIPNPGERSPQNVFSFQPVSGDKKVHVAEKPIEVLNWLVGLSVAGSLVLDPFMGSGAAGVAALQAGRKFIGIEIDPGYFKIAHRRILDAAPLFVRPKP